MKKDRKIEKKTDYLNVKDIILDNYKSIDKANLDKKSKLILVTNFGLITGNFVFPVDYNLDEYNDTISKDLVEKNSSLSNNHKFLIPDLDKINNNDSVIIINKAKIQPFDSQSILKLDSMIIFTHQIVGFSYENK